MNLLRKFKLIDSKKRCTETCFNYDSIGKGCSYSSYDFRANEKVKSGEKCLHPEWSESKIQQITLIEFCKYLETSNYR